ncbi:hypothetical protein [Vibrio profundi]|uniref:hypothetical protein n=1 Tax=Vibrio profundi TaxID=1774960 RepID=UPI0037368659
MKVLAIILVRAIALLALMKSIFALLPAMGMPQFWQQSMTVLAATIGGYIVVPILLSTLACYHSSRIANWLVPKSLVPKTVELEPCPTLDSETLIFGGTFLVGLYWFIDSFSKLLGQWLLTASVNYSFVVALMVSLIVMLSCRKIAAGVMKLSKL